MSADDQARLDPAAMTTDDLRTELAGEAAFYARERVTRAHLSALRIDGQLTHEQWEVEHEAHMDRAIAYAHRLDAVRAELARRERVTLDEGLPADLKTLAAHLRDAHVGGGGTHAVDAPEGTTWHDLPLAEAKAWAAVARAAHRLYRREIA